MKRRADTKKHVGQRTYTKNSFDSNSSPIKNCLRSEYKNKMIVIPRTRAVTLSLPNHGRCFWLYVSFILWQGNLRKAGVLSGF